VKCPATGDVVGSVPIATAAEVETAAARLRGAQPAWQQLGVQGRANWLGKWPDWMLDPTDDLLTLVRREGRQVLGCLLPWWFRVRHGRG
jgi:acyl-CoA reductase-like NAD-dependent aldehyde dehydrogenase